jgi:hypothetical protein
MQTFKPLAVIASMICGLSALGYAESAAAGRSEEHRGQAYVFFAPGAAFVDRNHTGTAHIGGGGEVLLYRGLGAGAEVGYVTPWRDFSAGIGMLSINGSYHFNRNSRLSPFISGG